MTPSALPSPEFRRPPPSTGGAHTGPRREGICSRLAEDTVVVGAKAGRKGYLRDLQPLPGGEVWRGGSGLHPTTDVWRRVRSPAGEEAQCQVSERELQVRLEKGGREAVAVGRC